MPKPRRRLDTESDLVTFRLDAEFRKLLQDEATRNEQPKPNLYARTLVQRALTDTAQHEMKEELDRVKDQLFRIREDVATVALLLLVRIGKEDPKKAEAWIREHLAP